MCTDQEAALVSGWCWIVLTASKQASRQAGKGNAKSEKKQKSWHSNKTAYSGAPSQGRLLDSSSYWGEESGVDKGAGQNGKDGEQLQVIWTLVICKGVKKRGFACVLIPSQHERKDL